MKFSERIGMTPVNTVLQIQSMSDSLRNSIWNLLDLSIWKRLGFLPPLPGISGEIEEFSCRLWFHYFKKPIDSRPNNPYDILKIIRDYYFESAWYEVYDFLEFILLSDWGNENLIKYTNRTLEDELSGYRFIESAFVPVTNEIEVEAIQKALSEIPFSGVHAHLEKATEHLSRRDNPDYRNSIKESISAVESMARNLTGNPKATLGEALSTLEKKGNLHSALRKGFSNLYGYTSDEAGIRHAMLDEPNITVADATFFLVACSAFINYLKANIGNV